MSEKEGEDALIPEHIMVRNEAIQVLGRLRDNISVSIGQANAEVFQPIISHLSGIIAHADYTDSHLQFRLENPDSIEMVSVNREPRDSDRKPHIRWQHSLKNSEKAHCMLLSEDDLSMSEMTVSVDEEYKPIQITLAYMFDKYTGKFFEANITDSNPIPKEVNISEVPLEHFMPPKLDLS